jgi:hypothetical protein
MKAFAFGLVVGALACFGVVKVADRQGAPDAAPEPLIVGAATPSSCPDVHRESLAAPAATSVRSAGGQSVVQLRTTNQIPAAAPTGVPPEFGKDWIERLTERQAQELCTRANQLQAAREQGAKDAEPKDAGWAYPMEQLMRQHIEMHLPADKYTTLRVECRTTFCELRMEGASADGRELAEQVVQQIQHQPWSDIAQKGNGGGSSGESWHLHYDWIRPRTESERRAWFWNRDLQRQQREREREERQQR